MERVEYHVNYRRALIIWTVALVVIALGCGITAMVAHMVPLAVIAGLSLLLALATINAGLALTVADAQGVRTSSPFGRRSGTWDDIASVDTREKQIKGSIQTKIRVNLTTGGHFMLKAPISSSSAPDPALPEALRTLRFYLETHRA
jgi:hypothetical protein